MTMMPEIQCTIKLIYIITGSKFKSTQMLSHNRIGFIKKNFFKIMWCMCTILYLSKDTVSAMFQKEGKIVYTVYFILIFVQLCFMRQSVDITINLISLLKSLYRTRLCRIVFFTNSNKFLHTDGTMFLCYKYCNILASRIEICSFRWKKKKKSNECATSPI